MEEAALCEKLYVIDSGRIALMGTPKDVFTQREQVRQLGLDVPDMTELAAMLISNGISVRPDVLTIDEMEVELCRLA